MLREDKPVKVMLCARISVGHSQLFPWRFCSSQLSLVPVGRNSQELMFCLVVIGVKILSDDVMGS